MSKTAQTLALTTGATGDYVVGGGILYFYPIDIANPPTVFPTDAEIEQNQYNVGVCSSGFKIKGKPKIVEITDSNGNIIRNFMTQNKITIATGFTQWNLANYQLLCGATLYQIADDGSNAVYGAQNNDSMVVMQGQGILPTYLVRLVNNSLPNGQIVRFTTFAQPTEGFTSNFDDKPNEIDATMTSILFVQDFMASIRQSAGTTGKTNSTGSSSSNNNINNSNNSRSTVTQPQVQNTSGNTVTSGTPTVSSNGTPSPQSSTPQSSTPQSSTPQVGHLDTKNSSPGNISHNANGLSTATLNAITADLRNNGYNGKVMATHVQEA